MDQFITEEVYTQLFDKGKNEWRMERMVIEQTPLQKQVDEYESMMKNAKSWGDVVKSDLWPELERVDFKDLKDKEFLLLDFKDLKSSFENDLFMVLKIWYNGTQLTTCTGATAIVDHLKELGKDKLPLKVKLGVGLTRTGREYWRFE